MKNKLVAFLIFAGIFLAASLSLPTDCLHAAEDVSVHITAVVASQESEDVDPELKAIADEIKTLFTYSSYKKLKRYTVVLDEGSSDRVILPQDNPLVVTYKGMDPDGKISIQLDMNDLLNADFSVMNGGHILIGGPEYNNGNLILLIEATQ